MLELVRRRAHEFDVLHFHIDFHPFSLFTRQPTPFVNTLHGRLDQDWVPEIYDLFPEVPLVSVSDCAAPADAAAELGGDRAARHAARPADPAAGGRRRATTSPSSAASRPRRASRRAIRIAAAAGARLQDRRQDRRGGHRSTYRDVVAPLLHGENVEFLGEIDDAEKPAFLSGARALLFPIDWPEPFGLVMIEAMACGCPVIAYAPRQRARGRRGRADRLRRRQRRRGGGGLRPGRRARPRRPSAAVSSSDGPRRGWRATISPSTSA